MSDPQAEAHREPGLYEIRLKGHLGDRWASWFEGMRMAHHSDGTTILTGQVVDQAALYGLLRKVRDLGLPLLSVRQIERTEASGPDHTVGIEHNHTKEQRNT